jgi:hypothetical protein
MCDCATKLEAGRRWGAMPITGIFWSGTSNRDIHVLGGQTSRDLTNDLFFVPTANDADDLSAHDYLAANNDVNLTFQPLFNGTLSGNVFSGLHIDVDTRTDRCRPGWTHSKTISSSR